MIKLDELFTVEHGTDLELINCDEIAGDIPFISRTSSNNGIAAFVKLRDDIPPMPGNAITVALGGSVLSSFYQKKPFYTSFHIAGLYPKQDLSVSQMIFYCAAIEKNKYKYNYGRQANKTLKEILVPAINEIPRNVNDTKPIIPFKESPLNPHKLPFNPASWQGFLLKDLFDVFASQDNNITESNPGKTPYISSSQQNNGISAFIYNHPSQDSNTITVARNGSVGSAFYHPYKYCASPDDVRIFKPKFEINKYIALFLTVLIEKEKYRYAYGRKFGTKRMKETKIFLPVKKDKSPDWEYVENYVKTLPYSSNL